MDVYLVGLGGADAKTFHVMSNLWELDMGARTVRDLKCDLAEKHNTLEELICIMRSELGNIGAAQSDTYHQGLPSVVVCDDLDMLEGTHNSVLYNYIVQDISHKWHLWKGLCPVDMAPPQRQLNDFFFEVICQEDMTEALASKLLRHVAEDRERCYDWNGGNEKYQYGGGGLLFTCVVRRWTAFASALVELITDPIMLAKRKQFFNADCGNGVHEPLKQDIIYYLCDRKSWCHNKIAGTPSLEEVSDEDYTAKWLPLAEKVVRRLAELEGAKVNLNWFRSPVGCRAAYYQPKLMKMFFPDGVPHDSKDAFDLCQCLACLESRAFFDEFEFILCRF